MAAVLLRWLSPYSRASAGSAQSQTTTELSIVYHSNGDSIAVPGKLHPTDTLEGPDGNEYPVFHDDSKAYFRISRSGGGSLFSQYGGVIAHINYTYAEADRGLPIECNHGSREAQQHWHGQILGPL